MIIHTDELPEEKTAHGADLPLRKRVIAAPGVIPGITQIAKATFSAPCSMRASIHSHPTMWECYYVLKGNARYTIGDQIYEVRPGDFFAVPPGTPHFQEVIMAPHVILYWGVADESNLTATK